jgi:hypothetical protein
MATRKIFYDGQENHLQFYVNDNGDLFLNVTSGATGAYIVLDSNDVEELIDALGLCYADMG